MASIGEMLANVKSGKLVVSPLRIHATVDAHMKGGSGAVPMADTKYEKERIKALKAEIKAIDEALESWIPEDVAARAKRSLEHDRALKKAQLLECSLRLKQSEEEMEDSDYESEEDE